MVEMPLWLFIVVSIFAVIGLIAIGACLFGILRAKEYERQEIKKFLGQEVKENDEKQD